MMQLCGGVTNISNTCYISSSLEILFRYQPIVDFFNNHLDIEEFAQIAQLANHMEEQRTIDPTVIIDYLNIDPKKQQDICEFLAQFLEFVSNKLGVPEPNEFTRLFSSIIQREGDVPSDSFIFFTIPVIAEGKSTLVIKRQLESAHFVGESSDLFFVQIQRMIYDKSTKSFSKNIGMMDVIEELDLREYHGKLYQLFAVSLHKGSGFAGHYITFIKDSQGWLKTNDDTVTAISEKEFYDSINRGGFETPYLLAYTSNVDNVRTIRNEVEAFLSPAIGDVDSNQLSANTTDNETGVVNILPQMSTSQSIDFSSFGLATRRSISTYFVDSENDASMEDFTNSLKPEPKYNVTTKVFDPLQFEVIRETKEMLTKQQLKDMVLQFNESNLNAFFSLDGKEADNTIPQELWVTQKPLYIYAQSKDYRIFDIDMYEKPYIELTFNVFQTVFEFSFKFDQNQTTKNVREYVSNFLFNHLDMVDKDFELLVQNRENKYYLLPSNCFTPLQDLFISKKPSPPSEDQQNKDQNSNDSNEKKKVLTEYERKKKMLNHITIAFDTLMPDIQDKIIVKVYTSKDTTHPSRILQVPYRTTESLNDVMEYVRTNVFLPTYCLTVKRTPKILEQFPMNQSVDDLYKTSMNHEIRVQERPSESTFQFVDSEENFIFMHDIDPNATLNEVQLEINKIIPNCILKFTTDGKTHITQKDFVPMTCKDGYFVIFMQGR